MELYIQDKKNLHNAILNFLDGSWDNDEEENDDIYFREFIDIINNQIIHGDREEIQQFLEIIRNICDNHHRGSNFITKVCKILQHYKTQIKQTLSNNEIFNIFGSNKIFLLYLLKNDIITMSDRVFEEIINKFDPNGNRFCYFFYPELENFMGEEKMKYIKDEILSKDPNFFENYENKRQEGENDSYICSMIRKDEVEDFISFVNHKNYSLTSLIEPSFFETNQFLMNNKKITLIEYSAFFGSIQIFQYLLMNNVRLTSSLWLYIIHSKNAEMIHLLESNNVHPPRYSFNKNIQSTTITHIRRRKHTLKNTNYMKCYIESIKCHHNDIADYIENNLLNQNEIKSNEKEIIISNCIKYHNYSLFQIDTIIDHGLFYLCFYNYEKLVDFLLKEKENEIESKIILYKII